MTRNIDNEQSSLRYEEVAEQLRRDIESGALGPGDRLPSLRVLRHQHGVTQATVDRAYLLLEKEGLIVRSPRSGIFVARPDQKPTTGLIGFCGVSFTRTEFSAYWTHLMEGVEAGARKCDAQIVLLNDESPSGWDKVDGVLVNASTVNIPADFLHANLPLVGFSVPVRLQGNVPTQPISLVMSDDTAGARAATEHLLSLGHRRVAFINNSCNDQVIFPRRLAGYQDALRDAGITPDERWLRSLPYPSPALHFANAARQAMQRWIEEDWKALGCTALLAQNDDTAWGAIEALREAGIAVPEEVSVVGFDGTEVAECCDPPLTTVEVPLRLMGEKAVELLWQQAIGAAQPAEIVLPTQLRVRASTAPAIYSSNVLDF